MSEVGKTTLSTHTATQQAHTAKTSTVGWVAARTAGDLSLALKIGEWLGTVRVLKSVAEC